MRKCRNKYIKTPYFNSLSVILHFSHPHVKEHIITGENISTITLESTDSKDIKVFNIGVYTDVKNQYINIYIMQARKY